MGISGLGCMGGAHNTGKAGGRWQANTGSMARVRQICPVTITTPIANRPVYLTTANFPDAAKTGENAVQADGGDIRFSSDALGQNLLPCHIVNTSDPLSEIRVTDSAGASTIYFIFSGDAGQTQPAVTDSFGRNAVYAAYAGFWNGSNLIDNTGKNANATNDGATFVNEKVGKGFYFAADNYYTVAAPCAFNSSAFTVSGWFQCAVDCGPEDSWEAAVRTGGGPTFEFSRYCSGGTGSQAIINGNLLSTTNDGTLNHFALTYDGSHFKLYKNGSLLDTGDASGSLVFSSINIQGTAGVVDEISVSSATRSAAWIAADYANENNPATFATPGTPQPLG